MNISISLTQKKTQLSFQVEKKTEIKKSIVNKISLKLLRNFHPVLHQIWLGC